MCKVLDKDTISLKFCPICLWLNMVVSQKGYLAKGIQYIFHKLKTGCQFHLTFAFHDVVSAACEPHALQPLALVVVSVRAFRAVAHARVCGIIVFV